MKSQQQALAMTTGHIKANTNPVAGLADRHRQSYILKAKKFAEPLFQQKKIAEKVRKSGRHFWAIWG